MTDFKKIPQDKDLEQAVIGAMLISKNAVSEAIEVLKTENVFFEPKCKEIYSVLVEMYRDSQEVDILTVSDALRKRNKLQVIGGESQLIDLTQKVGSSAHIQHHCRILQQNYVKRRAIEIGNDIARKSYEPDEDIFNIIDDCYRQMDKISDWLSLKESQDFSKYVEDLFDVRKARKQGVPLSISKMQKKMNGYRNSDLIIVAGRPGMGKTAYMLNDALFQAKNGYPVGIFSLEMSGRQLTGRMLANEAKVDASKIGFNTYNSEEGLRMLEVKEDFSKLPIYIEDQAGLTPLELKVKVKKLVREKSVKVIYIDYLQLMSNPGRGKNREQEISEISRGLKALAKELDIPIVALSQLSRNVESRPGHKRPMLSDLRESGAIEQDADIVKFLYRPEYYKMKTWDDDNQSQTKNQVEVILAKFRNGTTGSTVVGCLLKYMRFMDLEDLEDEWENNSFQLPPYREPKEDEKPKITGTPEQAFDVPF